ncbi:unnamed protein product [Gadus morhua 'NCC']
MTEVRNNHWSENHGSVGGSRKSPSPERKARVQERKDRSCRCHLRKTPKYPLATEVSSSRGSFLTWTLFGPALGNRHLPCVRLP